MRYLLLLVLFVSQIAVATAQTAPEITPSPDQEYAGYVRSAYIIAPGPPWQTWPVRPNGYDGEFLLSNQIPAQDYVITCLLDYLQVPCEWDGTTRTLYPVSLDGGEEVRIPLSTPRMSDDFHDFIVMAFGNPFSDDLSDSYRISTDLNYLYRSRLMFVPRDFTAPENPVDPYKSMIPDTAWIQGSPVDADTHAPLEGVIQTETTTTERIQAWNVERVEPGEQVDYFLQIGAHPNGDGNRLAIIAFLNYEQIPLQTDGEVSQMVLFSELEPGERAVVPVSFQAPAEPGIHELMIVHVYNPFTFLETPPLGTDRDATEVIESAYSSIRTAIVVDAPCETSTGNATDTPCD